MSWLQSKVMNTSCRLLIRSLQHTRHCKKSSKKHQNERSSQTVQLRSYLLTFIYGCQTLESAEDAATFLEQNIQTRFLSGRREGVHLPERVALQRLCYGNVRPLTDFSFHTEDARCPPSTFLTVKSYKPNTS